jgi:DNA repair protein RadC
MSEEKPEQTFFLNEPSAKLSPKLSPKQPAAETDRAWRNAEQKSELPGGDHRTIMVTANA